MANQLKSQFFVIFKLYLARVRSLLEPESNFLGKVRDMADPQTEAQSSGGSSDSPQRKSRRRILIYPQFQGTLIAINTLVLSVTFGILGTQVHRVYLKLKDMGTIAKLAPDHAYFGFVRYQADTVYWSLFLGFLLCLVVGTGLSLFFSHRLAGPLVRMRNYLQSLQEKGRGGIDPLQFRKRDYFSDLPEALNRALERVEQDSRAGEGQAGRGGRGSATGGGASGSWGSSA